MSLVNYLQLADRTDGFFIPSVTLVGPGCVKEVGPRAKMLGAKRALIVTDAGLHKMGLSQEIADLLRSEGIDSQHTKGRHTIQKNKIILAFNCIKVLFQNGFSAHGINKRYLHA